MQNSSSGPPSSSPIEQEIPLLAHLEGCEKPKEIIAVIRDRAMLQRCSIDHLTQMHARLSTLRGRVKDPRREAIDSALSVLRSEIGSDEIRRGLFIRESLSGYSPEGPTRIQLEALAELVIGGAAGRFHPCSRTIAEADMIRELWQLSFKFASLPCSIFEMSTGGLSALPPPPLGECLRGVTSPLLLEEPSDQHLERLYQLRQCRLKHLALARQLPGHYPVTSKLFPPTRGWIIGCSWKSNMPGLETQLMEIALKHDICPIAATKAGHPIDEHPDAISLRAFIEAPWPQDMIECGPSSFRLPCFPSARHHQLELEDVIIRDRLTRHCELWSAGSGPFSLAETIASGRRSWRGKEPRHSIALATALNAPCSMNLTYTEGGNTLIGTRENGGACAIVGLDSLGATKAILEIDLGRQPTQQELEHVYYLDFGCEVIFVEQPGDFHLDMSMAFVAPGVIALNSSVEAADLYEETFRRLSDAQDLDALCLELRADAAIRQKFEDHVATQLTAQGFQVIRIPGRFMRKQMAGGRETDAMNFFNFITAQTPRRENLVVALGIETEYYQQRFEHMWRSLDQPIPHFEYLDLTPSQANLEAYGGASCRTKTIPLNPGNRS